jgi:antitoxin CptB
MNIQLDEKKLGDNSRYLSESDRSRLYWQCRRGMLELDLLLQGFFDLKIDTLTNKEIVAFTELLECADDQLLGYFMGRVVPSDQRIAEIVSKIRHAAQYSV